MLTTFTGKASECEIKRPMRVGKNEAGGPEKQVILFVWPYEDDGVGHAQDLETNIFHDQHMHERICNKLGM